MLAYVRSLLSRSGKVSGQERKKDGDPLSDSEDGFGVWGRGWDAVRDYGLRERVQEAELQNKGKALG